MKIENGRFILNKVKGIRSSGSGVSPNRRYSPRPARCGGIGDFLLKRKNSDTDSYSLDERRKCRLSIGKDR